MDQDTRQEVSELRQLVEAQATELHRLRGELRSVHYSATPAQPNQEALSPVDQPLDRRQFGRWAGMAVGGAVATMAAGAAILDDATPAAAIQGSAVDLGADNTGATKRTGLFSSTTNLYSTLADPDLLIGETVNLSGGSSGSQVGVFGSGPDFGVVGYSPGGETFTILASGVLGTDWSPNTDGAGGTAVGVAAILQNSGNSHPALYASTVGSGNAGEFHADGAGASLYATDDEEGTGAGLEVVLYNNMNASPGVGVVVSGTGPAISTSDNSEGTGPGLEVEINPTNSSPAVEINYNGKGNAMVVNQQGGNATLFNNSTEDAAIIVNSPSGTSAYAYDYSKTTNGGATNFPLLEIGVNNTSAQGNAITVTQQGSGAAIGLGDNGNGIGIGVLVDNSNADNDSNGIQVTVQGAGSAIAALAGGNATGAAVFAESNNPDNTLPAVQAKHLGAGAALSGSDDGVGTGPGLQVTLTNTGNDSPGVSTTATAGPGISATTASATSAGIEATNTGSGPALMVNGPARFSRSGIAKVVGTSSKSALSVRVKDVALTSSSLILATAQTYVAGVGVAAVVPDVAASGFTINLTEAVEVSVKVAWFVVG